jgi:hypothetical protein
MGLQQLEGKKQDVDGRVTKLERENSGGGASMQACRITFLHSHLHDRGAIETWMRGYMRWVHVVAD